MAKEQILALKDRESYYFKRMIISLGGLASSLILSFTFVIIGNLVAWWKDGEFDVDSDKGGHSDTYMTYGLFCGFLVGIVLFGVWTYYLVQWLKVHREWQQIRE